MFLLRWFRNVVVLVLVVLVVFGIYAGVAYREMTTPPVVSCGQVTGGAARAAGGANVAEKVGELTHAMRDVDWKAPTADSMATGLENAVMKVLWKMWVETFIRKNLGLKLDPRVIKTQQLAASQAQEASDACTPCPGAPADTDDPNASTAALQVRATNASQDRSLTGVDLAAQALLDAGFPVAEIPMGVTVAGLESGYNRNAINPAAFTKGTVRGMFQVYYGVHPELSMSGWDDPYKNARDAYSIWKARGRSWQPWSTAGAAERKLRGGYVPPIRIPLVAQGQDEKKPDQVDPVVPVPSVPKACQNADGSLSSDSAESSSASTVAAPSGWDQLGNPHTVDQAIQWMAKMDGADTAITPNMCSAYVSHAYGWPNSGSPTALSLFASIPAKYKSTASTGIPPRGALVFWRTSNAAGHIAISDGAGGVWTTDAPRRGQIGHVSLKTIDSWGPRAGYAAPFYPAHQLAA